MIMSTMGGEQMSDAGPEFVTLEEAAAMTTGTRVTFIPGLPALYAEALKNICFVKGVPLIRALHPMMGVDKETGEDRQARLYALTSQTSIPTMFHDQERPRNVWLEQLGLAERIGAPGTPKLIPDDFAQRAEMMGLCEIVLGEDGLVWNMRIMSDSLLAQKYGYSDEASAAAPGKVAAVLKLIDGRLAAQEQKGSRYLVGNTVTAADVYWATMSMCVLPPSPEIMPLTRQNKGMLKFFGMNGQIPVVAEVLTERIGQHQRYILSTYCETPAVLGGDPL
jgi:glutathione S-transferase